MMEITTYKPELKQAFIDLNTEWIEWELAKMAVSPQSQGMGAGNALIEALLDEARRRNIKEIYLEGNTRLAASIHMYRKHGFVEIPLREQSYEWVDILMSFTANGAHSLEF